MIKSLPDAKKISQSSIELAIPAIIILLFLIETPQLLWRGKLTSSRLALLKLIC